MKYIFYREKILNRAYSNLLPKLAPGGSGFRGTTTLNKNPVFITKGYRVPTKDAALTALPTGF